MFVGVVILTFSISSTQVRFEPPIYPKPGQEVSAICNISLSSSRVTLDDSLPLIYMITPTYSRREQIAELTRLGQTLLNVPNLHWIISEDADHCSPMIEALLQRFGMPFTHIISPMPKMYNRKRGDGKPRGVSGRRAGMQWIKENWQQKSVLYFGDDDNTYDLRLFEEIRQTEKVSVFPVAFIGPQSISSPVVEYKKILGQDGKMKFVKKVVGFSDGWFANRKFALDMAGFAVNVEFLASNENASMPYKVGYEEDYFIQSLNITINDLEPLADGCTQVGDDSRKKHLYFTTVLLCLFIDMQSSYIKLISYTRIKL
jgi:beta-1,3-glucuronyltransferase